MPISQSSFESQRRRFLSSKRPAKTDNDMQANERLRALTAARKELHDKVRDDWVFIWPPVDEPEVQASEMPHLDEGRPLPHNEPESAWRERELDSSPSPPSSPGSMSNIPSPTTNPYRFDTPDAVAQDLSAQEHERHRTRRKQVDEEASWNDGLRCWNARRDAWSGGRLRPPPAEQRDAFSPPASPLSPISPATSSPSTLPLREQVPLAGPLLPPTTWNRTSMSPALHSKLYTKVVLQSERPTLPINLRDMTQILVQGWKENNEWPPKMAAVETLFARKRDTTSERSPASPSVVVQGLALREKAGVEKRGGVGPEGHRRSLSKSMGAMKKALGITSPRCESPAKEASERER
ncbi:MAG: hypothetical protein M1829_006238 [Trizodia sp. TS-e1964]|nr:MAG: hypothetical protein M1829_006238 [Trizodia sp. TS-e1964]